MVKRGGGRRILQEDNATRQSPGKTFLIGLWRADHDRPSSTIGAAHGIQHEHASFISQLNPVRSLFESFECNLSRPALTPYIFFHGSTDNIDTIDIPLR